MAAIAGKAQIKWPSPDEVSQLISERGSKLAVARELGVSQGGMYDFCRRHGIDGKALKNPEPVPHSPDFSDDFSEIPVFHRDYRHLDTLRLYPLGDVHIGSHAYDEASWLSWLDYVTQRSDASMLGTGDFLNVALKTSVSEVYDETETVGAAKRRLRRQLKPLADKGRLDLLMPGNHEARVTKAIGDCPIHDVADALEVPYAPDVALLIYHVGAVDYQVYVRHGTGAGDVGARATRLAKMARTLIADVYVSGHTHSQLAFPQDLFHYDPQQDRVVRRAQKFISSGSFLRLEPYAARAGFAPQKIGAPRIRLSGKEHDVKASV